MYLYDVMTESLNVVFWTGWDIEL